MEWRTSESKIAASRPDGGDARRSPGDIRAPRKPALLQRDQLLHYVRIVLLLQAMHLLVVLIHLGGIVQRAELGAAHGAEGRLFVIVVGQGFVVHRAGGLWVERERELFFPIELVAGIAERVVAVAGAGTV